MNHGPLKVPHTDDGLPVPFYAVPFDAGGSCTAPETVADATGVFMVAHGRNDDRADALIGRYAGAPHRWWNPVSRPSPARRPRGRCGAR